MKLASWNVNGIRAAGRTTFASWFEAEAADVVCVQEIKAVPEQLDEALLHPLGYHSFWHSAQKPGYSGVAVYSKKEPLAVQNGLGIPEIDQEGRVIRVDYSDFVLLNCYFPNSQREHTRLDYKLRFCQKIQEFAESLKQQGKNLVICGDLNIAHQEIDLANPKSNENNAGFLPEERAWLGQFLKTGYIDCFRSLVPDPRHYTWWSYRPGVREKNIGWRLDYFLMNQPLQDRLKSVLHRPEVKGSDHCPVVMDLE